MNLQTVVSDPTFQAKPIQPEILPHLEPVICRTMEDIKTCFKLRYEEYCLHRNWENADEFPDRLEMDSYDDKAVHILLLDRERKKAVGTVRVIYHRPDDFSANGLPSFQLSERFRSHFAQNFRSQRIVELSRFTIVRDAHDKRPSQADFSKGIFPALALIKGVFKAIAFDGVDTIVMTIAPSLKRLLARTGFEFHDIGVRVEHRGVRAPIYRNLHEMIADLYESNADVWRYCSEDGCYCPTIKRFVDSPNAMFS